MLDILYIALTIALFSLVSLVASGVERPGPRRGASARREAVTGEDLS
ncbi:MULTISPECIES: hypothetical protein [unclassified Microbacterium]|nr:MULTISPECIES: hypothetical protein [unclassified Microbacterium]MBT2484384.1 hypothetical protein [Microbacterium sp. ISL-108]